MLIALSDTRPTRNKSFQRRDLGADASVGGWDDGVQQTDSGNDPVIIVHGITNKLSRFNVRIFTYSLINKFD